jgi:hypothetical protein
MKKFWIVTITLLTMGLLIGAKPAAAQFGFGLNSGFRIGGAHFGGAPIVSTLGPSLYPYNPYNMFYNPYGGYGVTYVPTPEGYEAVPYPLPPQPMGGYPYGGPNIYMQRPNMNPQSPVNPAPGEPAAATPKPTGSGQIGDTISAHYNSSSKLVVKWDGNRKDVESITFALLDNKQNSLLEKTITANQNPEVELTVTNATAYYEVLVKYVNGFQTKVISPI